MNSSSEAADAVIRMYLQGIEMTAKITGAGAKNFAVALYAYANSKHKTKGKIRLDNLLKSGKELVYSTCSILKQENEEIVNKVLKEGNVEIVPIEFEGMEDLPILPTTIDGTLCVCPDEYFEGFFIAKLRKK